ncbi:PIR Superfamily Protein [Plasmodium ovale wallikeri]|uniref:PIR Superfamily Protein n=1 Tax=Plasmodium ovale wallikeri TaxID=864142 RepID=A0A1A9AP81_PLAOA|nr:PIR Superfamily Protein [Plasmodium ovale wallikeri]
MNYGNINIIFVHQLIIIEEEEEEEEEEDEEEEDEKVVEDDCNKIPPELCSSNCHIHKLNSCETKDIKLLCDYLEKCSDTTKKCSIESDVSNSKYCETFNKIIDVYNDEIKCKDGNSDDEYCQEVIQCREKYLNKKLSKLKCTEVEYPSLSQKPATEGEQFQVVVPEPSPLEHGTGSGSTTGEMQCAPSGHLAHAENKSLEISLQTEERAAYVSPNCDVVSEKKPLGGDNQTAQCVQVQSQTLTSSDTNGSHTTASISSPSCPLGSGKESCENSFITSEGTQRENIDHLNQSSPEHAVNHSETHMNSKEEFGVASIIIISASTVLGISFLVFMLYKFTPIGSLLNNIKEKKPTWNINETQYNQKLLYNPELGNTNSNNNKYNIAYYSLTNS